MIGRFKKSAYEEAFDAGSKAGFAVIDHEHIDKDKIEGWYTTPYNFRGQPVIGYAVTKVDIKPADELRESNTMEFYVTSPRSGRRDNVEDIVAKTGGSVELTLQSDGSRISYDDAREALGRFASASSEYPHVMNYPEYARLFEPIEYKGMRIEADAKAYSTYLDSVGGQLRSGEPRFVGRITTFRTFESCRGELEEEADYLISSSGGSYRPRDPFDLSDVADVSDAPDVPE